MQTYPTPNRPTNTHKDLILTARLVLYLNMSRTEYKGSCLCGGVKYTLHGEPEDVVECYCSHCQLNAGGESQIVRLPFALNTCTLNSVLIRIALGGKILDAQRCS